MKGIAKRSLVTPFAALAVAVTAFVSATSAIAQAPDPRLGATTPVQIMGPLPVPVTGTVSGAVSVTGTVGIAPGSSVTVANTVTNPVPVTVGDPVRAWQGTPLAQSTVVINQNADGFEFCEPLYSANPGEALIFKTATGDFNVPPAGTGGMRLKVMVFGASALVSLTVPTARTAPASQFAGPADHYAGSLDGGGIPIIAAQACVTGPTSRGQLAILGFVVATPR